jgi:hypothetical protein
MQLSLGNVTSSARDGWIGALGLLAFDVPFLGGEDAAAALWIDGQPVPMKRPGGFKVLERQSSNDWSYAAVDMTPLPSDRLKKYIRHLLHVEPDLFVVCDEVHLNRAATVDLGWEFSSGPARDAAREEWRVQLPNAGLTARILGSPRNVERLAPADSNGRTVVVRSGVTNETAEFHQVTLLVPHERDARRSLAFKLLESDTAIGARVHRDGLPTLVAIRKSGVTGGAELTGLKFTNAVAVDVFRPRRK